jgi:hypothetical protein
VNVVWLIIATFSPPDAANGLNIRIVTGLWAAYARQFNTTGCPRRLLCSHLRKYSDKLLRHLSSTALMGTQVTIRGVSDHPQLFHWHYGLGLWWTSRTSSEEKILLWYRDDKSWLRRMVPFVSSRLWQSEGLPRKDRRNEPAFLDHICRPWLNAEAKRPSMCRDNHQECHSIFHPAAPWRGFLDGSPFNTVTIQEGKMYFTNIVGRYCFSSQPRRTKIQGD